MRLVSRLTSTLLAAGVASTACAQPVVWSGNGHYYEIVLQNGTWSAARTAAESRTWLGVSGHLVSITSAAENQFLTTTFGGSSLDLKWTGGFQPAGSPEPGGGWTWTTGEAFSFNGWSPGEPNNVGGSENVIVFAHALQSWGKPWSDFNGSGSLTGFVVEYPVPGPGALPAAGIAAVWCSRRSRRTK